MPDIDTDFDDVGRQKVIDYVVTKYGRNQVAQIVTYGTMAQDEHQGRCACPGSAIARINALAKLVPERFGIELQRVLEAPLDGEKPSGEREPSAATIWNRSNACVEIYKGKDLQAAVLRKPLRLEGSVGIPASMPLVSSSRRRISPRSSWSPPRRIRNCSSPSMMAKSLRMPASSRWTFG